MILKSFEIAVLGPANKEISVRLPYPEPVLLSPGLRDWMTSG